MSAAEYSYLDQARAIRRALLVTAYFERKLPDGTFKNVRLSDQMRRVIELVNELSYGAEPPSDFALFRSRVAIGRALAMDEKDVREALGKAEEFKVIEIVESGDGFLRIELRAAKLAVAERALVARGVIDEIEIAQRERVQQMRLELDLPGCARSHDQARDYGLPSALDEAAEEEARERLAGLSRADARSGRFPESAPVASGRFPERSRGDSPNVDGSNRGDSPRVSGRFPEADTIRARADSKRIGTHPDSYDSIESSGSGAVGSEDRSAAAPPGSRRFRDDHKNHVFAELVSLDSRGELKDETCRRSWVGRIRDEPHAIDESIGEVKDEQRRGHRHGSPLGRVFSGARKIVRGLGRELRSVFFT